jgi:glycine oxidase
VRTFDVVVVGGGIIGTSIAFELAAEKLRVVLLDSQQAGRESSWAAAGMLSPSPHTPQDIPLVPFAKESLSLYAEFAASIEGESGKLIAYELSGVMDVFTGPSGEADRAQVVREHRALGLTIDPITLDDARSLEPGLGPLALAAAWLPEEGTVDPRLLMDAVIAATQLRGAELRFDSRVSALLCDGPRCNGVAVGAEKISAGHVVVAAGCFSGGIPIQNSGESEKIPNFSLNEYAPTRPIRGQMMAVRPRGETTRRVLRSAEGYLVPRPDGRIIVGSTLEDSGFEKSVTAGGLHKFLAGALKLWPALDNAEILETWCGLRPGTPDDLPILGPTGIEGLTIATGHYRNGILLAPATAKFVREWITRGNMSFDAQHFSPLRFLNRRKQRQSTA